MISRVIPFIIAVTLALVAGALPTAAQDWQLVWSEEFDVDGLVDESKWSYDVGGGGWGNEELQYYTERRSENVRVEDGHLVIEAISEPFGGRDYTSGRIVTRGKGDWLYGRMEVRAMLPPGLGTWPAIWMLSTDSDYGVGYWPDTGEIDIMEAVGHDPGRTHSSVHTQALNSLNGSNPSNSIAVPDSYTEFHVYVLEWTPTRVTTFVDGEVNLVYERNGATWQRWPFDRPFHLLLNLAVGGTWGGLQGVNPDDFPTKLVVDYVRVYEDAAGPPDVSFTNVSGPVQLEPGAEFSIEAVATDPVSDIESITIYQGDAPLAAALDASTTAVVEDVHPGCYDVRAVAVDSDGWTGTSDVIPVTVGASCGQAPYLMRAHRIPGRIEAEHYDLGGPGVAFTDLSGNNTGGGFREAEAVDIGPSLDVGSGYRIQDVTLREWVEYTAHVEQGGLYRLIGRVTALQDGSFSVSVNGEELPDPFTYT
ncbi:MAG: family 16 glycosylhydrolase, partial [Rhodothermales bacterium]|nr:family 16 glycosylhydrolase [Rhodothermales bacterium]